MPTESATGSSEGLTADELAGLRPADQALRLYRAMAYARAFEERIEILYRQGAVRGPAHLALGHEAVSVGVAAALEPGDRTIGTYRGHAHALAKGAPAEGLMRELLGRDGGICEGKGGSMHVASIAHGYMGSHAIIGAHIPVAAGLAWASQIRGDRSVTVCFFGDGATNIGAFHEGLNLAAIWKLPVVFVCENNGYMEYTPIERVIPVARPAADRASAYGLAAIEVDGNDVNAVRSATAEAVAAARNGAGPTLIEAVTYRHSGHSVADPAAYRSSDEVDSWKERDPLLLQRQAAVDLGVDPAVVDEVLASAREEIAELARECGESPAPRPATAWTDMWSDGSSSWRN